MYQGGSQRNLGGFGFGGFKTSKYAHCIIPPQTHLVDREQFHCYCYYAIVVLGRTGAWDRGQLCLSERGHQLCSIWNERRPCVDLEPCTFHLRNQKLAR